MKKSGILTGLCAALLLSGGLATAKDQYDIRPDEKKGGAPSAVEWQNKNERKIAAATTTEALSALVATPEAADALLAKVAPAYASAPIVLTQVGALTSAVLSPGFPNASACRKVWVEALKRRIASSGDDYVKTFCRQQLDVCRESKK